jgi:hypothetical protein
MKKAIAPPALLTVAKGLPLRIIATKSSATVIKETNASFFPAARIFSINNKTNEIKSMDTVLPNEPEWYANYE